MPKSTKTNPHDYRTAQSYLEIGDSVVHLALRLGGVGAAAVHEKIQAEHNGVTIAGETATSDDMYRAIASMLTPEECESQGATLDQDWEPGRTTATFGDGVIITFDGGDIEVSS